MRNTPIKPIIKVERRFMLHSVFTTVEYHLPYLMERPSVSLGGLGMSTF